MSNSLVWTTLKKIGIDLPISQSNPLFRPRLSHKKNVFSKENKRKEEIYLSRTVLLLTFTFSLISELSRGFAAMPVCYGVNGLFLFVLPGFVFNVIFRFHFVHCHSNMHSCTFFFEERLVIHPAIHSFVVHSLYHLPAFLSNPVQTGHG